MKKIVLFSFAFAALSLASCKKERTCTCTVTSTDVVGGVAMPSTTGSYTEVLTKATKGTAKSKKDCMSRTKTTTSTTTLGGVVLTTVSTDEVSCTIK